VTWGSRIRILERHDNNVSVEGCNFVYDQMKSTRLISMPWVGLKGYFDSVGEQAGP
jgi:hypothetical protein